MSGFSPYAFGGFEDPDALARRRSAELSREIALREDFDRLQSAEEKILRAREARKITPMAFASGRLPSRSVDPTITQELLSQAVNRFSPGVDKYGNPISVRDDDAAGRVADHIEGVFGKLEDRPSWSNEEEYAKAGRRFAEENAHRYGSVGEAYNASKHLMSPQRYQYMQDVGRTVDLLRSLHDGTPVTSWQYYSQSKGRPLARLDSMARDPELRGFNEAGYERFRGQGPQSFFQDPVSPVAWYLRAGQTIPNAIKFSSASSDPLADTAGNRDFYQAFRRGPNEVLDIPSLPENATPEQVRAHEERYAQRAREVAEMEANLQPPSWHSTINAIPGLPNVPAGVADIVGTLGDALDPSLLAGLPAGALPRFVASSPDNILAGLTASRGSGYAAELLSRAQAGGVSALGSSEQALMHALGRSPASRAAGSLAREAGQQAIGEGPWAVPSMLAGMSSDEPRTYLDYWTKPSSAEELDGASRARSQAQMQALGNTSRPDIWSARSRHAPTPTTVFPALEPMY